MCLYYNDHGGEGQYHGYIHRYDSISSLTTIKSPVSLAHLIMDRSPTLASLSRASRTTLANESFPSFIFIDTILLLLVNAIFYYIDLILHGALL